MPAGHAQVFAQVFDGRCFVPKIPYFGDASRVTVYDREYLRILDLYLHEYLGSTCEYLFFNSQTLSPVTLALPIPTPPKGGVGMGRANRPPRWGKN